jgi:hypothetical protein
MSGTPGVGYRVSDPDSPKGSELPVLVIRGINPAISRVGEARRGEPGGVYGASHLSTGYLIQQFFVSEVGRAHRTSLFTFTFPTHVDTLLRRPGYL